MNQYWHAVYTEWQDYHNPDIHEYGKSLGLSVDDSPTIKDGIVRAFFCDKSLELTINGLKNINLEFEEFYQLNSYGMRCDEFIRNHNGAHVLFAGCSITVGEGMFMEYTWPYLVYSQLKKEHKLSGYFNISNPGFTIISIVWQLFQYFKNFGNPNILFLNLPDIDREIRVVKSDDLKNQSLSDEFSGMLSYAYYSRLLDYCNKNNIKLYSFTWDFSGQSNYTTILDTRKYFKNFYIPTLKEQWEHSNRYVPNLLDEKHSVLIDIAFDGAHPGIRDHDFFAEYIYNIYKKEQYEEN